MWTIAYYIFNMVLAQIRISASSGCNAEFLHHQVVMQNFCIIRLWCRISASSGFNAEFLHHQVVMQTFCIIRLWCRISACSWVLWKPSLSYLLIQWTIWPTLCFHRVLRHAEILHYENVEMQNFCIILLLFVQYWLMRNESKVQNFCKRLICPSLL